MARFAAIACCALSLTAFAADADDQRARQNYLLQCAGCHGEGGAGLEGHVPTMRDMFARFAMKPEGRAYLLRVPGVTQSSLDPERLAEVLNWALREFSTPAAARAVQPFTAAEVAAAKTKPLIDVTATRERLLETLPQSGESSRSSQLPANEVDARKRVRPQPRAVQ